MVSTSHLGRSWDALCSCGLSLYVRPIQSETKRQIAFLRLKCQPGNKVPEFGGSINHRTQFYEIITFYMSTSHR